MSAKQRKSDVSKVKDLASRAADNLLGEMVTYSWAVQHAGKLFHVLADLYEKTDSAYIHDEEDRKADADARAMFAIGVALGRRLR